MTRLQIHVAAVLVTTAFSVSASAQLVHQYTFHGTGTVVTDSVGTVNGVLLGGSTLDGTGRLELDGNDYVEFPAGFLGSQASGTFEAWYTWTDVSVPNWPRIMDFGNSSAGAGAQGSGLTYLALTPKSVDSGTPTAAVRLMSTGSSTKALAASPAQLGVETHIALSLDATAGAIKLYIDGVLQQETSISLDLTSLVDENNWLGRSQFQGDPGFEGSLTEFRVYADVLSEAEVAASFAEGPVPTFVGQTYCSPSVTNSTGAGAKIFGIGSPAATENSLVLGARDLPRFSFSFFIVSSTQGLVNQPAGSAGVLCLGGAIGRYVGPGQIQQSNLAGEIELALDLTQIPQPNGFVAALPGDTWNYQAWYRDSSPSGPTSNFTDGLSVTFN